MPRVFLVGVVFCALILSTAADETCYSPGGVAGILVATIIVTLVVGGLGTAGLWYLWRIRFGEKNFSTEKKEVPPTKQTTQGNAAYAFDNPYFKDDEIDASEKGESKFYADNGDTKRVPISKQEVWNVPSKAKWNRPFSAVFQNSLTKKPRALDDTCIKKQTERVTVSLKGHDFTGLGFNICGSMRDGIFVKDILHRGPASESGKIKAGDRIVSMTVSFSGMVYEDALTILSYASPYDVQLELEKSSRFEGPTLLFGGTTSFTAPSPGSGKHTVANSFHYGDSGQRLFHPLYRSQSTDDLFKIGKNGGFPVSSFVASRQCKEARRSQSIETATTPKTRLQVARSERTSALNQSNHDARDICDKTEKTISNAQRRSSSEKSVDIEKKSPDQKSARFRIEKNIVQKLEPVKNNLMKLKITKCETAPSTEILISEEKQESNCQKTATNITSELSNNEDSALEVRPVVPPRKISVAGKRKAPAPPNTVAETSTSDVPNEKVVSSQEVVDTVVANDIAKDKLREISSVENNKNLSSSSPKRKAASLGDLTKFDENQKKSPISSTILERAVSLDLQQQPMPVDNLSKQKEIMRAPTFEDPEDTSQEDLGSSVEEQKYSEVLKEGEVTFQYDSFTNVPLASSITDADEFCIENTDTTDISEDGKITENISMPASLVSDSKISPLTLVKDIVESDSSLREAVNANENSIPTDAKTEVSKDAASISLNTSNCIDLYPPVSEINSTIHPVIPSVSTSIPVIKSSFKGHDVLPALLSSQNHNVPLDLHTFNKEPVFNKETGFITYSDYNLHRRKKNDDADIYSRSSSEPSSVNELSEKNVAVVSPLCITSVLSSPQANSSNQDYIYKDTNVAMLGDTSHKTTDSESEHSSFSQNTLEESFPTDIRNSLQQRSEDIAMKHSQAMQSGVAEFAKTLIVSSASNTGTISLLEESDTFLPQ